MRYSVETPRMEKYGMQGTFVPTIQGTVPGFSAGATGAFAFSGHNGLPATLWPINFKGIEPRVGVAYVPHPTISIRASWGLIHEPLTGVSNSIVPDLSNVAATLGGTTGGTIPGDYVDYITDPIASAVPPALYTPSQGPLFQYASSAGSAASGASLQGSMPFIDQSDALPYIENYTMSVQWQPVKSTMTEVAYVGSHGIHLFGPPTDYNAAPLSTLVQQIQAHCNFSSSVANPTGTSYGCTSPSHPNFTTATQTLIQYLRPYPQFYNNVIDHDFNRDAYSHYNAIYLSLVHRHSRSLQLSGSFTWQKSTDDSSNGSVDGTATDSFGFAYPQSPYNLAAEYALSTYDIPVSVKTAYVYYLPFGRGRFFNVKSRWADAIVGGWDTGGIFRAQSGVPMHVQYATASYFASSGGGNGGEDLNIRPNLVPGQPLIKPNWKSDPFGYSGGGYLNPAAFVMPGSVDNPQFGAVPRTLGGARSPRTITFDATLRKSFQLEKSMTLQLSADAINATNHANYFQNTSLSGHDLDNAAFGNLGTASVGRYIALGALLSF